ncbi:MAG: hypothetical protein Q9184_004640 [Pyrenodesmia sp. 2 TL-2023]
MQTSSDDFKILGAADRLREMPPASTRPLPVFTSSFGFPKAPMYIFTGTSASGVPPIAFAPTLYSQTLRPSGHYSGPSLPTSIADRTHDVPAPEPEVIDLTLPDYQSNVQTDSEYMDTQFNQWQASIKRLVYGQEAFSSDQATGGANDVKDRRMNIGKILNGQPTRRLSIGPMGGIKCGPQDGTVTLANGGQPPRPTVRSIGQERPKHEAEVDAAPPAKKRRRYGGRPDYNMMSSIARTGKKYYGGPNLERFAFSEKEHYTAIKRLGAGSEGTAHLVKNRWSGAVVVCKVIPHLNNHNHAESELFFLRDALYHHSRIINLQSALISPSQTELYLDYCDGGDMATFIEANHWKLKDAYIPEAFVWHAFLQLSEALAFIHYGFDRNAPFVSGKPELPDQWLPVIHRDIKPANILLQRARFNPDHPGLEAYPRLVLADFGLALQATEFNSPPSSYYSVGTYVYQPPECPLHSPKGDVWSIGATVFEMCMGRVPFDVDQKPEWAEENADAFRDWCYALSRNELEDIFRITEQGYTRELQRCLMGALEVSVDWRMTSLELMYTVECSWGRKGAVWEPLHPLVFEGMRRGQGESGYGQGAVLY